MTSAIWEARSGHADGEFKPGHGNPHQHGHRDTNTDSHTYSYADDSDCHTHCDTHSHHPAHTQHPELHGLCYGITQGIQDLSNSVPLVRGKTAWVRAYVRRASGASNPPVSAEMRRVVNGQATGSYIYPSNPGGEVSRPAAPTTVNSTTPSIFSYLRIG